MPCFLFVNFSLIFTSSYVKKKICLKEQCKLILNSIYLLISSKCIIIYIYLNTLFLVNIVAAISTRQSNQTYRLKFYFFSRDSPEIFTGKEIHRNTPFRHLATDSRKNFQCNLFYMHFHSIVTME